MLEIVRSYNSNINMTSGVTGRTVKVAQNVFITEIYIGSDTSIKIQNFGTVGTVHNNYGTAALLAGVGGVYENIKTSAGTVGEMLGSVGDTPLLYKTADGEYLRADNEACKASTISNVQVMFPPLIYVEITGAGNSSGERHDYKYALTAKAGETVTLKSGAYELG